MADEQNSKRRGRPPKRTDADGKDGDGADGAEENTAGAGEAMAVMSWAAIDREALKAECNEGQHGRRVVRVFAPKPDSPEIWHGTFGAALVDVGDPAYQLSDGSIITL